MESNGLDMNFFNGTEEEFYAWCNKAPTQENENMWESNALIAAFEATGGQPEARSVDFAKLKELGVHAVILRCGTSGSSLNYDDPSAGYVFDSDYGKWFRAATDAGLRVIIDYDFNPMLDSVNAYDGSVTKRHINQLISGGLKPSQGGALMLNCERNTWNESVRLVTCMSNLYGKDLRNISESIWSAHGLVPGVRTGKWFLEKKDTNGTTYGSQMLFMDQGETNYPIFFAKIKKSGLVVSTDFHEAINDVTDPHVTSSKALDNTTVVNEQAYYLYYGNKTKWSGWELAWIKNSAVLDASGNMATFRLILWNGTPTHFDEYFNFPLVTTPGEGDGGGDTTNPAYDQKFALIKSTLIAIANLLQDLANKI
jgi:hypothetical protein